MASPHSNTMFVVSIAINTVEYVLQSWLCCCSFYKVVPAFETMTYMFVHWHMTIAPYQNYRFIVS